MSDSLVDALKYEVSLVADGMSAGRAKAVSELKQIEDQAAKTGTAIDRAAGGDSSSKAARDKALADLAQSFRNGTISQKEFETQSAALGVKLKTLSAAGEAAAAAFVAEGTAATGAAIATEAASVATKGLLATFAPFLIAMLGIELAAKLVKLALQAIGVGASEAQQKIDDFVQSALKAKQAAFDLTVAGRSAAVSRAQLIEDDARRTLDDIGSRSFSNRNVFDRAQKTLSDAIAARIQKEGELTKAQQDSNKAQDEESQGHNQRLANLISEGNARKEQTAELKRNAEAARAALAILNASGPEGVKARQQVGARAGALSTTEERNAVEAEQNRLQTIIKLQDDLDKAKEKSAAKDAKTASQIAEQQRAARAAFDQAIAAHTPGKGDDVEAQIARLTAQAEKAGLGAAEIAKRTAELRKTIADSLGVQIRDLTARSTVTAVDDLTNALDDLKKKMGEEGASQAQIDQVVALQQPMIDATRRSEELATAIENIQRDLALGFNLKGDLAAIEPKIDAAIEARNAAPKGTTAQKKAQDDLDKLLVLEVQLREKIKQLQKDAAAHTQSIAARTAELASDISKAAYAAYGLAAAFLGVDSNITKALASIGEMTDGISKATEAWAKGDIIGTIAGVAEAAKGALDLGKVLFGEDPAVTAARKETLTAMEGLKAALLALKDAYLQNVSTSQVQQDIASTQGVLNQTTFGANGQITFNGQAVLQPGEGAGPGRRGTLRDIGRTLGQDFDSGAMLAYFKKLDALYGTNLASFIERQDPYGLLTALRSIPAALKDELGRLGTFADDAAGVIARVNFEFGVLGRSDPLAKFRATIKALQDANIDLGEFSAQLKELADPNTTAARAAEIVQEIVTRLSQSGINFGNLTPEQLRALVAQGADAFRGTAGAAGTGGFNEVRTITEITGSRIAAMLSTGNIFAEKTAANTALIAQLLGGTANPGAVPPPSIPTSGGSSGGSSSMSVNVTVNMCGLVAGGAEETGRAIGNATVKEISRGLASDLSWKRRAAGVLVTR